MGEFPIIPSSGITRDSARTDGQERATTTTTTTTTAASGAEARSSAAADRERRFLRASRVPDAGRADATPVDLVVARRRRRDAAAARPRRNTWHAGCRGEVATDRDPRSDDRSCVRGAAHSAGLRDVGIVAGDDRRTCCVLPIDAAAFLARRRRRVNLVVARPVEVSVDSITTGRDGFLEIPHVATTDFSTCNAAGSPTIGESTDGGVNTENPRIDPARLTEISIVESSCKKRPCVLAEEEAVRRRSTSSASRLPAKIDPGGAAWRMRTDTRWKSPSIVQRALLLGLLATSLLCDAVLAAPPSSSVLDYGSVENEELATSRNGLGDDELEIIRRSIVQGLGLQRIPDASKANVSQAEYERAHREYLKQVQLSHDGQKLRMRRDLHVFQAAEHPGNKSSLGFSRRGGYHRHSLYFPVVVPGDAEDVTVDHASLRFLLQGDHSPRDLEALVYLRTPVSRRLLLRREIPQGEPMGSRWLELDSTEAAASWLEHGLENHGLELEFLHDGRPTRREISHATLNVFAMSEAGSGRRKRSTPEELLSLHKGRRSKCKGDNNKKCCRHELMVMFKDLKGFEFIVYPKHFDAGYCKGRCPPRYNPAHHHALLQSLLWKEDRKRVPKPCCAPSKLEQLMIVYFDENDSTQLKVSYWKNIQVVECACS